MNSESCPSRFRKKPPTSSLVDAAVESYSSFCQTISNRILLNSTPQPTVTSSGDQKRTVVVKPATRSRRNRGVKHPSMDRKSRDYNLYLKGSDADKNGIPTGGISSDADESKISRRDPRKRVDDNIRYIDNMVSEYNIPTNKNTLGMKLTALVENDKKRLVNHKDSKYKSKPSHIASSPVRKIFNNEKGLYIYNVEGVILYKTIFHRI